MGAAGQQVKARGLRARSCCVVLVGSPPPDGRLVTGSPSVAELCFSTGGPSPLSTVDAAGFLLEAGGVKMMVTSSSASNVFLCN